MTRAERLAEIRQRQPITELERKFKKARGRYSRQYWTAEAIDYSFAKGRELFEKLRVE
jgi:hypothetical protein